MSKDLLYPLRRLHGKLHARKTFLAPIREKMEKNPGAVFLIMTPEHDNLGDQALAWTEETMLRRLGIPYIELTGMDLLMLEDFGWLNVMNGRTVLFNGGGYLGSLWPASEEMVRKILKANPKSTICMLPNTLYYEDTPEGQAERQRSKEIYGRHKKLHLYAREQTSYGQMKQLYENVKLAPDVVLSMDESGDPRQRSGCVICLREDSEKTRTPEDEAQILHQAGLLFGDNVISSDMYAGHRIRPQDRERELRQKFDQFKGAELVITDRLHGMIFCAITATPCIVVGSKSHKILGCYEWIKNLEYIRFADRPARIGEIYSRMQKTDCRYHNAHLRPLFDALDADLLRFAGKSST